MDGEANLPVKPAQEPKNLVRPSLHREGSPPGLLRNVQAAFKRHRPLGTMQTNTIRPRRGVAPQCEVSGSSGLNMGTATFKEKSPDVVSMSQSNTANNVTKYPMRTTLAVGESHEDESITAPSVSVTITKTVDKSSNTFDMQRAQSNPIIVGKENNPGVESQHVDGQRKVQFLTGNSVTSQEMEWAACNLVETPSSIANNQSRHQNLQTTVSNSCLKSDAAISSSLAKRTTVIQDQLQQFRNFLGKPATQSSVAGSSCATTTSIHSSSAPNLNSTTYVSNSHLETNIHASLDPPRDTNGHAQPVNQEERMRSSLPSFKDTGGMVVNQNTVQTNTATINTETGANEYDRSKQQQCGMAKENETQQDSLSLVDKLMKDQGLADHVNDIQSHAPPSKNIPSDLKVEPPKLERQEKVATAKGASVPRKRSYDPDLFFKVNGKFYQRLGKIGSGGSSEVHKVISSDCKIYALKKIKLKGRDYATAFGFCQEIGYLNKLKGKNNIIQLIDYEVTDKSLLQEVMNGSMSNKDSRVKDDGCIYMVLEYGEIDLAHMLSQKWKEVDDSNQTIDENWLRFYWQQILQAVNTIHEERIVHSDLKPANFLLVRGSLKLIDFGIAKAIMSDTTNIQRDSQVGTLSYMSPEAFMCNESDENGNTIKCGRPSDIWSLGCILYQMVYGRTPFAEYKTFWAKFKVITDPSHEITYEPVSNPWLLDLMKKCLAWDRTKRWRIPELLQHPFLVPPIPSQPVSTENKRCKLIQLVSEACSNNDQDAHMLCSKIDQLLSDPVLPTTSELLQSGDHHHNQLLSQLSNLCLQLQERLVKSENKKV